MGNIKKYSNNSSSSDTKVDSIRCIEGQKKKIKTTLDNLFGEQQDMKKGVLQTTDDLEDGEISEEEIIKDESNTSQGQKNSQESGSKDSHCNLNTLNTHDLEDLIEAKKHEMEQLKAEEH